MVRQPIPVSSSDSLETLLYSWHRILYANDDFGNYTVIPHYPLTHHKILQYPRNKWFRLFYNQIVPNFYQIKESKLSSRIRMIQQKISMCDESVLSIIERIISHYIELQLSLISCLQTLTVQKSFGKKISERIFRKCRRIIPKKSCFSKRNQQTTQSKRRKSYEEFKVLLEEDLLECNKVKLINCHVNRQTHQLSYDLNYLYFPSDFNKWSFVPSNLIDFHSPIRAKNPWHTWKNPYYELRFFYSSQQEPIYYNESISDWLTGMSPLTLHQLIQLLMKQPYHRFIDTINIRQGQLPHRDLRLFYQQKVTPVTLQQQNIEFCSVMDCLYPFQHYFRWILTQENCPSSPKPVPKCLDKTRLDFCYHLYQRLLSLMKRYHISIFDCLPFCQQVPISLNEIDEKLNEVFPYIYERSPFQKESSSLSSSSRPSSSIVVSSGHYIVL